MKRKERTTKGNLIGLALGSGSARGWAHIGVLRALRDAGIEPHIVCGVSVGALIGAAYAAGELDMFEKWVRSLHLRELVRYIDIKLVEGGGFVQGIRLMDFLREHIGFESIEDLPRVFGAVATDLSSGREIWFTRGPLFDAVRASLALPGIFTPVKLGDQWLVDGGLVNPVPVSLCRALGAKAIIAVNLNGDIAGRHFRKKPAASGDETVPEMKLLEKLSNSLREKASSLMPYTPGTPGLFDVLAGAINIMQDRITKSRMAGDPPDVILAPRLGHVGLLEFDRADESIREGARCVERMLPALKDSIPSVKE